MKAVIGAGIYISVGKCSSPECAKPVKQPLLTGAESLSGKHSHVNDVMHPHNDPGRGVGSHYPQSSWGLPRGQAGIGAQIISRQTLALPTTLPYTAQRFFLTLDEREDERGPAPWDSGMFSSFPSGFITKQNCLHNIEHVSLGESLKISSFRFLFLFHVYEHLHHVRAVPTEA